MAHKVLTFIEQRNGEIKKSSWEALALGKRLASRDMHIELSSQALDRLAERGFDPVYGARPLKRAIQDLIENPLAKEILSGKFAPGDRIAIDAIERPAQQPGASVEKRKAQVALLHAARVGLAILPDEHG